MCNFEVIKFPSFQMS